MIKKRRVLSKWQVGAKWFCVKGSIEQMEEGSPRGCL